MRGSIACTASWTALNPSGSGAASSRDMCSLPPWMLTDGFAASPAATWV
jgi:hypothetical protein